MQGNDNANANGDLIKGEHCTMNCRDEQRTVPAALGPAV